MYRRDRIGRRGGGVILNIKESIQAYEIKLERDTNCDEVVRCLVQYSYRKFNINYWIILRKSNIKHESLGNSDPNQIHFDIKVKSESTNKKYRRNFHKGKYKDMRKYLATLDWNNMQRNKTAIFLFFFVETSGRDSGSSYNGRCAQQILQ